MMMIDWVKNRLQRTPSDLPDNFQTTSSFQEVLNPLFAGHKHHLQVRRSYESDFARHNHIYGLSYWIYIFKCSECNELFHIRVTKGKNQIAHRYFRHMEWWR